MCDLIEAAVLKRVGITEKKYMPGPGIPEIKWGTFEDSKGIHHIAPEIERRLMSPHILTERCYCGPRIEIRPNVTIIVHYIVH